HIGLAKKGKKGNGPTSPGGSAGTGEGGAAYWNPRVHPQTDALEKFTPQKDELKKYRKLGFTAALIVPVKGIFKGSSALVSLGEGKPNDVLIKGNIAQHLSFERGGGRESGYPGSLMGAIALIRQTFLDAQWYREAHVAYAINPTGQTRPEENEALRTLSKAVQNNQTFIFEVNNELDFLRALKIAREFDLPVILRGSGYEYRILDEIGAQKKPIILPLNFPQELGVETPQEALQVNLSQLQHWNLAPENPALLQQAGILFSLTASGLEKPADFWKRVRQAVKRGLSEDAALTALTVTPAKITGVENRLGTLEKGKMAHLIVTDGNLFSEETHILDAWIDGARYEVTKQPPVDPRGKWEAQFHFPDGKTWKTELQVKGKPTHLLAHFVRDKKKIPIKKFSQDLDRIALVFAGDSLGKPGMLRATARVDKKRLSGKGELPDGSEFSWSAKWIGKIPRKEKQPEPEEKPKPQLQALQQFISGAFERLRPPEQPKYLFIKNATVWTSGPRGKLENAELLIVSGKISKVGVGLNAPKEALIIDAAGKHVTPGLIDAHSHSGISGGVNEAQQAVTAEVRIGDVINPTNIAFYRELAGGLTASNLLHGSANPIGGQNAVVKLRWGSLPEDFKFKEAMPGIKFALGENVKQSNWGDNFTTRYPQTRMGVEQIIRDRFKAALDYEKAWLRYDESKKKGIIPPRRDLELETLLEILHGKRLIHCHSYRQDEILMLMRLAEEFGFRIGVFQHVLEGYKVADVMAAHGAGGSTFSDWWAYKFEVYDAIPYNGALMHDAGVVVSYNSDSNELARRLNTEAAKAVKYGGVSEEEALKFVTLNPAIQLRIDHKVGSLEPGKDADFVIWSGPPLSTYSVCEQTWIEGRKYFDRQEDLQLRREVKKVRRELIQKYLASKTSTKKDERKNGKSKSFQNEYNGSMEDEEYSCKKQ
ncbi:MAG: amidohydrolase family protein, partial [Calditrichia bacterium]